MSRPADTSPPPPLPCPLFPCLTLRSVLLGLVHWFGCPCSNFRPRPWFDRCRMDDTDDRRVDHRDHHRDLMEVDRRMDHLVRRWRGREEMDCPTSGEGRRDGSLKSTTTAEEDPS